MWGEWKCAKVIDVIEVTDYVANGSFESLRDNVTYRSDPDYAVLVRLVDFNAGWKGSFVYVDKTSYEFLRKSALDPGDIVIANVGANAGTVFRVPELGTHMTLGPNAVLCRPRENKTLQRDFLYYYLVSDSGQMALKSILSGSAQPNFNKTDLRSLLIPIPPIPIQHSIAGVLSALDDKIKLNRRMNATLEAMARAVYRKWFVESTDLSKWKSSKIGDFANLDKGVSYKGDFLTYEGIPMINLGCFLGKGKFDINKLKNYSGEFKDRHTVKPGDIVLANTDITQKREVIGSPAIVPDYPVKEYLFSHHVYAVRVTNSSLILKNYLYFTLLQEEFRERAEGFATGTTVLALPRDAVLDYVIPIPPADLLLKFFNQVHPMLQKVQSNIKDSLTLARLRDVLLPKLMRGKIRVKV